MKARTFSIFAVSLIVASILLLGCRPRDSSQSISERRAGWLAERISDELELNEAQKATLDRIKREVLTKEADFRRAYAGLVDEIVSQVRGDRIDEEVLNKSLQEREQKLRELRSFLVSKFGEFHGSLTPEQRKTLADRIERFRRHRS